MKKSNQKISNNQVENIHFFWEIKGKNKARFNLLLLDHGEYLMEDLSGFNFPIPMVSNNSLSSIEVKDSLKIQGRLKLCSKSLIFVPNDVHHPILKFPFKNILSSIQRFNLKPAESKQLSVEVSGLFTFTISSYFEMKENNKISPYKLIDSTSGNISNQNLDHILIFALTLSNIEQILVKIEQLRNISLISQKQGNGIANKLLQPFIEAAQLWTLSFNTSNLVNFHEILLFEKPIAVKKIRPLTNYPGSLMITDVRAYFEPSQLNNTGDSILHFELTKVKTVFRRRYLLRQTGLEFMMNDGTNHLFVFDSNIDREDFISTLLSKDLLPNSLRQVLNSKSNIDLLTQRWQRREISNFEYLMKLNNEADRSVNDLTQYPVFPHVISDFTSEKLQFNLSTTYRDLSKPIGALNPSRLQHYKDRYHSMPKECDPTLGIPPPFLYGTHYSTPGYVLFYLVRVAPEYMLCLQNGKFDSPDRMFHSIESTWDSCLNNPADLKELIPEFFTGSGDFLVNFDDLDLGHRHTGERLNDVILPPWADSPKDFIRKNLKALESNYVSEHLHDWIDLIFGYKQRGIAAIEADNLYYYLTYEGMVDIDSVTEQRARDALIMQIQEFGQTPKQLFTLPHPSRNRSIIS